MSLGSGFPEDFRLAQIRRRLRPGSVIKLFRRMDDGQLHEKRFVVLHVDCSRVRSFLTEEVVADLMSRPEWILGDAANTCCNDIAAGIKASETLAVAEVERICRALSSRE
jgi:hypothetical protein